MKIPIRDDYVLYVSGRAEVDPKGLERALAPLGLEAHVTPRFELVEAEIKKLLLEHGVSYVWQLVPLQEDLMTPSQNRPALAAVLKKMIRKLAPKQDFVIVDRYLLPKQSSNDYLNMLFDIIKPIVRRTQQLVIITASNYDNSIWDKLRERLHTLNPNCHVAHRCSENFHDRFWIADNKRGLFLGTSLNGLGRRYALVDYLAASDVQEIITALKAEKLL